jgi:hypothetical protein
MTLADDPSRRDLLMTSAVAALSSNVAAAPAVGATSAIQPLTSRSGVYTPARGASVMQFGFDFPEPSVEIDGLLISFRIHTFENAYAIDAARTTVDRRADGSLALTCEGLLGAGGQQAAQGRLTALFQRGGDGVLTWRVEAQTPTSIKSVATIVRGLPRGALSVGCAAFEDHGDDEVVFEYPELFGGLSTPLIVLKTPDGRTFELAARQAEVRPARFLFQPGPDGYRVELIYEREGWTRANTLQSCPWRVGPAKSLEAASQAHFAHVAKAYDIPRWESRADAPAWMRDLKLVVSIHGAHWTGYIYNTYAKALETLRWVATQIDPRQVMVFLPAWDGRYYWNYPNYLTDPRMGGDEGFKRLINQGQAMGFRLVPMFGSNSANKGWPAFTAMSDAVTDHIDGDAFDLNWVDWDNDRRNEGWSPFMNLGVASWRRWLSGRISAVIERFGVDGYFLDIAGAWENNRKADMNEGTRQLVADLAARHPGIPAIGEMLFDAQMAYIPMSQVVRYAQYPAGADAYVRSYQHLSRPAPGRGSTGVHESGFGVYDPHIKADQRAIPTLTVVDDTFEAHREDMAAYIAQAKGWTARRG